MAKLSLSDGFLLWIIFLWNVAIAPGEDADVHIAGLDIGQAFIERALIGCDIILHRDDIMAQLAQRLVHRLSVGFEVAERRRDINS